MDVGLLIVRLVIGALFVAHGAQKLFGWFGGYGIAGTGGFMESLGFRPGRAFAFLTGVVEVAAGVMLMIGLGTPIAAAAVIGVMLNAVLTAKREAGLFGGWELDLVYAAVAVAIAFVGPGAYSLDAQLGWDSGGITWGLAALGLGVVAGVVTLGARRPLPAAGQALSEGDRERRAA